MIPESHCHVYIKRIKIRILKRYLYPLVDFKTIHNKLDMETTQMSIKRWMDTVMWYIYTIEYYTTFKRKEIFPLAKTWMNLEDIMLSEWSQRKTNYHDSTYMRNLKNKINEQTKKQKETHKFREKTGGYQKKEGWGWVK